MGTPPQQENQNVWEGKPALAFMLRAAVFVAPIIASIIASIWLAKVLPKPGTLLQVAGWWAAILIVSTAVLFIVDKAARRFLPLAALMQLTMVFPDKAPTRFKTALKSGSSVKHLKAQIEFAESQNLHDDLTSAAQFILQLTSKLNTHDRLTRGHAERVRAYVEMLAEEMEIPEVDRAKLRWAALLHDIGKLKVDADILNKPGALDDDEWAEIKKHPTYGAELCAPLLGWLGPFADTIEDHHERFDGNGYPNGKKGEEMSLGGRLTGVADAYDVMTTVRSYKKAMTPLAAREELARNAGTQFDPEVVRAFLNISMGKLRWVAGPLSWLAQLPFLRFVGAVQQVGSAVGVAGLAATATVGIVGSGILDIPDDPVPTPAAIVRAVDDSASAPEGRAQLVEVLSNDISINGSTLTIVTEPSFGTVVINPDGTVTYTPDPGFNGTDSFVYAIVLGGKILGTAEVTVAVTAVNEAPVAVDDAVTVAEDTSISIDIMANDSDSDGTLDLSSITLSNGPLNGTVTIIGGKVFYNPNPGFAGSDGFRYTVRDDDGALADAVVAIEVTSVNDAPTAADDAASLDEDSSITLDVRANDADPDGVLGDPTVAVGPANGSAVVVSGDVVYTPDPNFFGSDSFTYEVCDDEGLCATAVVSLTVASVNDAPVLGPLGPFTVMQLSTLDFDPMAAASDADGDPLSLSASGTSGAGGTVVINPGQTITYMPPVGFVGDDSFTVTVTDPSGASDSATVKITVKNVNEAPVASADSFSGTEDVPLVVGAPGVLGNDTDPDGDPLTATLASGPSNGAVAINADGSFTYTPVLDFFGTDSFSYTASDGDGAWDVATVTITVVADNDPPVAVNDSGGAFTTPEDTPFNTGNVASNDTDLEDGTPDASTASMVSGPSNGGVSNNGDGTFSYTPDPEFFGSDSFTYNILDADGAVSNTATVTISVTAVNDPPVAVADAGAPFTTDEDVPFTTGNVVTPNDTDVEDGTPNAATVAVVSTTSDGILVNNFDGTFDYTPDPNWFGIDSFTYEVDDLDGATSNVVGVEIIVSSVNDDPVPVDDAYSTDQGVGFSVALPGVLGNDYDEDGDPLTAAWVSGPISGGTTVLVFNPDGSFTYTPDPTFVGVDEFVYSATDGVAPPVSATAYITVDTGTVVSGSFMGSGVHLPDTSYLTTTPPPSIPLPDYDLPPTGDPGRTILAGGDETSTDPTEYHQWALLSGSSGLEIQGPTSINLWSSIAGFHPSHSAHPQWWWQDCDLTGTACTTVASGHQHVENWNGGTPAFVNRTLDLGHLDVTIASGRMLVLRLTVKHHDLWLAYDTAAYPSTVDITFANRPPDAVDDFDSTDEDVAVAIPAASNDVDLNIDVDSMVIVTPPLHGTAIPRTDGSGIIDYTNAVIDPDWNGVDTFTYNICDTSFACSLVPALVTVTVNPVNDPPSFVGGLDETRAEDDGAIVVPGWASLMSRGPTFPGPANESGQTLTFNEVPTTTNNPLLFTSPPSVDEVSGDLKYELAPGEFGKASFDIILNDGGGGTENSAPDNLTILVTPDPVKVSDLGIVGLVAPDPVAAPGVVVYAIAVGNLGPDGAGGVNIDQISVNPFLDITSAIPTQGSCSVGPPLNCALGSIPLLGVTGVTITANVLVGGPPLEVLQLDVWSPRIDPVLLNNSALIPLTIL